MRKRLASPTLPLATLVITVMNKHQDNAKINIDECFLELAEKVDDNNGGDEGEEYHQNTSQRSSRGVVAVELP